MSPPPGGKATFARFREGGASLRPAAKPSAGFRRAALGNEEAAPSSRAGFTGVGPQTNRSRNPEGDSRGAELLGPGRAVGSPRSPRRGGGAGRSDAKRSDATTQRDAVTHAPLLAQ